MDISGYRHFLPRFVPLPPPHNGAMQFAGLQIPLHAAPKFRLDRYPQDRKAIDDYFKRLGFPEDSFVTLTLTGFAIPFLPRLANFRPFGRGLGGLFRTTLVSLFTAGFGAHHSMEVYVRRNRSVWAKMEPKERKLVLFHHLQYVVIREEVLKRAGLRPDRKLFRQLPPGADPHLQHWLFLFQREVLLWKRRLHVIFWTSRMDKAWQEAFADPQLRLTLARFWKNYFQVILPPTPEKSPDFDLSRYISSSSETVGTARISGYIDSLPAAECQKYWDENSDYCRKIAVEFLILTREKYSLTEDATRYLEDPAERDVEWEKKFAEKWNRVRAELIAIRDRQIKCEELFKSRYGIYLSDIVKHEEVIEVLRLASLSESKETEHQREENKSMGTDAAVHVDSTSNSANLPSQSTTVENIITDIPEGKPPEDRNGKPARNATKPDSSGLNPTISSEPKTTEETHNPNNKLTSTENKVDVPSEDNLSPPPISKPTAEQKQSDSHPAETTFQTTEKDGKDSGTEIQCPKSTPKKSNTAANGSNKLEKSMAGGKVENEDVKKQENGVKDD